MEANELYTTIFRAGNRTYFFDLRESKSGDKYVSIVESKNTGKNEFSRLRMILFAEHIPIFINHLQEVYQEISQPDMEAENEIQIASKDSENYIDKARKQHPNAYKPWQPEDDEELLNLYSEKVPMKHLVEIFGRKHGAISSRIKKLKL